MIKSCEIKGRIVLIVTTREHMGKGFDLFSYQQKRCYPQAHSSPSFPQERNMRMSRLL